MMPFSLTPRRRNDPELMDEPGLDPAEVLDAYRILRRVNGQLGNRSTVRREFRRFRSAGPAGPRTPTVLDLGSGSGDILDALRDRVGDPGGLIALDRDDTATLAARGRLTSVVRGDALRLPFADRSIDLVMAVKFAHHFHGAGLSRLIDEMARVAARRVLVVDIRRHWFAYWGFRAWSRVFTRNRLVRYDGPLSVLRGFTRQELLEEASSRREFRWRVRTGWGFQLALVGERVDPAGSDRTSARGDGRRLGVEVGE